MAIAQLTPAADRPYFGGSTNNNILELALGYNGLGRLDGTETGSIGFNSSSASGGGGPGGGGFGGATGIFRLFQSEFGGQVSWLIPAALISLGALLWVSRRSAAPASGRGLAAVSATTRMRAFAAIWGGWLLVTGLVFSYMQGIIHPYYMVALAPAIGALVGVGASSLWQARLGVAGRVCAAVAVAATAAWSFELLNRTPEWLPWLRWVVLIAGMCGVVGLFAVPALTGSPAGAPTGSPAHGRRGRAVAWAAGVPVGFALVAGLAGPLAYSLDTVNSTHTGALPSAGPQVAGSFGGAGGPGGGRGGFGGGGFPGRGRLAGSPVARTGPAPGPGPGQGRARGPGPAVRPAGSLAALPGPVAPAARAARGGAAAASGACPAARR